MSLLVLMIADERAWSHQIALFKSLSLTFFLACFVQRHILNFFERVLKFQNDIVAWMFKKEEFKTFLPITPIEISLFEINKTFNWQLYIISLLCSTSSQDDSWTNLTNLFSMQILTQIKFSFLNIPGERKRFQWHVQEISQTVRSSPTGRGKTFTRLSTAE